MPAKPATVDAYLASLPAERRAALEAIRATVNGAIDPAFEEGVQYGMLAWYLPHSAYPAGYHCDPKQPLPFASVASQKNHVGLYLFCVYADPEEKERFVREWRASGKRLDMGASCVRVKKLEDVPLDVLAGVFRRVTAARFVAAYEAGRSGTAAKGPAGRKAAAKKSVSKKAASREGEERTPARRRAANKGAAKKAGAKKAGAGKAAASRPAAQGVATRKAAKKVARKTARASTASAGATKKAARRR